MIIVFGSIASRIHLNIDMPLQEHAPVTADNYILSGSGRGANQALAAAKSGAEVSLVGKVGDDDFATSILNHLRKQGVTTSGIKQSAEPTGIEVYIQQSGTAYNLITPGANKEADSTQIPEEILNSDALLLLQSEINPEKNATLLEKAKKAGVTTIMNLAPSIDLSQKALNYLDYLIVNRKEATRLAEKMGMGVQDDTPMQMALGFAKQGKLTCIITTGEKGCVAARQDHTGWNVPAMSLGDDFIDHSGADDAFCGTFAACLQEGLPLPRALKRAGIAASLTCKQRGIQNAFPSSDEIDEQINALADPQKIKL